MANVNISNMNGLADSNKYSFKAMTIPYGEVDSTSTSTAFTATVQGIDQLIDGTVMYLRNNVVTSASGFTLNINGLGAKPVYNNMADATRETTLFSANYTMLFVYNENRISGGCWDLYRGYNSDTTTGREGYYYFRPYAGQATYRYKYLMEGTDGRLYPIVTTDQTSATIVTKTPTTAKLRPWKIWYYNGTATVSAGGAFGAQTVFPELHHTTAQYNFNAATGTYALIFLVGDYDASKDEFTLLTGNNYYKFIRYNTAVDWENAGLTTGKYYLLLGSSYSTTNYVQLFQVNPFYYFDGTRLVPIYKKVAEDLVSDIDVPTKTSDLTNDSGFITSASVPSAYTSNPAMDGTASAGSSSNYAKGDHVHPTDTSRAPLASPAFTGTPTAPTASSSTDNTQIATTEFVNNVIDLITKNADVTDTDLSGNVVYTVAQQGGRIQPFKTSINNPLAESSARQVVFSQSGGAVTILNTLDFSVAASLFNSQSKLNFLEVLQASEGTPVVIRNYDVAHVSAVNQTITLTSTDDTKLYVVVLTCTSGTISGGSYTEVDLGGGGGSVSPSSATPLMDGTAAIGTSTDYARGDHVHPSDTAKLDKTGGQLTGNLTLYAASGDSPAIIFQRGTLTDNYNDWQIVDSGGYLYFKQRGQGSSSFGNMAHIDTNGGIHGTTLYGNLNWSYITNKPTIPTLPNQKVFYGYCSTAAATSAKVVSCEDFDAYDYASDEDVLIGILFANGNSCLSGTLNINNTGAVDYNGAVTTGYGMVWFTYNSTHDEWAPIQDFASTSNYGITKLTNSYSSSDTATAATPAAVKTAYDLANGKSTVSFNRSLDSGTQIGTITINGSSTAIYAPNGGGSQVFVVEFNLDNDQCDTSYSSFETALTEQSPVPIVVRAILNQDEVYMTSNIYKDYGQGQDIVITFMHGLDYFKLTYTSNGAINYTGWESLTNADTTSY